MRALVLLAALALLLLAACGEGSTSRECEPVDGTGCRAGRHCAVDATGRPRCLPPGQAAEGELCDAPEACGEGLGCVRVFGVPRCVRFCRPVPANRPDPCAAAQPAAPGRCLAALPVNDDIGVCVPACHPAEVAVECPGGLTCALSPQVGQGVCATPGEVPLDAPCGPSARCAVGLVCTARDDAHVCRRSADVDGACDDPLRPEPIPDLRDPVRDRDYSACVPCAALGRFPLGGGPSTHLACYAAEDREAAAERCATEQTAAGGGELARLTGLDAATQTAAVAASTGLVLPEDALLWTAAERTGEGWRWPDGAPVTGLEWASMDGGDCAALEAATGRLRAVDCGAPAHALCQLPR